MPSSVEQQPLASSLLQSQHCSTLIAACYLRDVTAVLRPHYGRLLRLGAITPQLIKGNLNTLTSWVSFFFSEKKHFRSFWAVDPITINTGLYGLSTDGVFIQWVLSLTYLSSTTSSTKMLQIDTLLKPMVRFNRGLGKSVRTLTVSFDITVASRLCVTS